MGYINDYEMRVESFFEASQHPEQIAHFQHDVLYSEMKSDCRNRGLSEMNWMGVTVKIDPLDPPFVLTKIPIIKDAITKSFEDLSKIL